MINNVDLNNVAGGYSYDNYEKLRKCIYRDIHGGGSSHHENGDKKNENTPLPLIQPIGYDNAIIFFALP